MLLGDDFAVELMLFSFLLCQQCVAPFLKVSKAPVDASGASAIEPDRRPREVRKKAPVVADEHKGGAPGIEVSLQPFDGGEIEMIGRLVEEQDIG